VIGFFKKKKKKEKWKLTFYMKSGNFFTVDEVVSWKIKGRLDNTIGSITMDFSDKATRTPIIQSIDLKQIECVITEAY